MCGSGRIRSAVKRDPVLFASSVLALLSMFIVPPSPAYLDCIDVRTLAILLGLMTVVAGISSTGSFGVLAQRLLMGDRRMTAIAAILVALPFFLSMFITNDVSLITFVPFAIIVLDMAGRRNLMVPVVVLQTVAANLGSMLLPFGNPQNIFIASRYGVGITDFLMVTGPFVAVGAVLLALMVLHIRGGRIQVSFKDRAEISDHRRVIVLLVLFLLCVMAVLRAAPYEYVLPVVLVCTTLMFPRILFGLDWGLLLTFILLFIFVGNLASLDSVTGALEGLLSWDAVVSSAAISQVISNVPATIMLSNFTADWNSLLAGVNIGGFGTPVASMASIITLRIYSKEEDADRRRFLVIFTFANVAMLSLLLIVSLVLTSF